MFRFPSTLTAIQKISLTQFRNYPSAVFDFTAPVTCITGPNGSGKTNLLDAVYYLCYTKSYFTAYQQNVVQSGTDGFRLEGVFSSDGRQETVSCKWKQGKKELVCGGVEYDRVAEYIGRYSAVMIAPDDLELINGGGELRRKWIDSILGQVDKSYLESLMLYQRVLQQRNAWLKQQALNPSTDSIALDYYNSQLATHGRYIAEQRKAFIDEFLPLLDKYYHELCGGREVIRMVYETDLAQKPLAQWLTETLQQDMRLQRTTRGIHRDDWAFVLNDALVRQFGSQGQKKSYLFALKLAQYAYLRKKLGHLPVLLLDDIFEKLDQGRIEALLRIINTDDFGQVLLTDTHAERVKTAFGDSAELAFMELGFEN
ncbi:DNA replication/repair protein RecF [Chitinophagaceae bacterium MMS25-I14]